MYTLTFHLLAFPSAALGIAAVRNIMQAKWTKKQILLATLIVQTPVTVVTHIQGISMLSAYLWVVLIILAMLFVFKLNWLNSIFIGALLSFISVICDFIFLPLWSVLPPTAQTFIDDNTFIYRLSGIAYFFLLYICSKKFKNLEYSPLQHFVSVFWILCFFGLSFLTDHILLPYYSEQLAISAIPSMTVLVLGLVLFLSVLFFTYRLAKSITETMKLKHEAELMEAELKAENLAREQKIMKDGVDTIVGYRHDLGNLLNGMFGYATPEGLPKLRKMMEEMIIKVRSTQSVEIAKDFEESPILHALILDKIHRAEMRLIHFGISLVGGKPDFLYCSDLDYLRIAGILLDNAMEAAEKSEKRTMEFLMQVRPGQLNLIIHNACDHKVEIDRIFERGYSTKEIPSGEGLYQARQIIDTYRAQGHNMQIQTTQDDQWFTQILTL